jgi:hypothetical protein
VPVEMIGWIAPRVSSELIPSSAPPFDADVLAETVRIHERKKVRAYRQGKHC